MSSTGWKEKDDRTIAEIVAYLEENSLDAFMPWKVQHVAYLLNYYDALHTNISWEERAAALVITKEGEAFTVGMEQPVAGPPEYGTAPWWLTERIPAGRPGPTTLTRTAEVLTHKGFGDARIGIERKWMPVLAYDIMKGALPDVDFVAAETLVPQIRFIKTAREQDLPRRSAEIGFLCMEAYMAALRGGATEEEAVCQRAKCALDHGGEWVGGAAEIVWTGGTETTPDWWGTDARERFLQSKRRLWRANIQNVPCRVTHLSTLYQYYFSDLAWHQFFGPLPDADDVLEFGEHSQEVSLAGAQRDFEILRRVQREALGVITPGMAHVDAKPAVDAFLARDKEAREHISHYYVHGVGLEIHEEPLLHTPMLDPTPLEGPIYFRPGAVVSSEWFTRLWTVEEPFVMTNNGWEPLVALRGLT